MFTSRAEYRLLLRQDNADRRLTEAADELGLVTAERRDRYQQKMRHIHRGMEMLAASRIDGIAGDVYLRRPEVTWELMCNNVEGLAEIDSEAAQQCLYDIKYEGWLTRQTMEVEKQRNHTSQYRTRVGPLGSVAL